MADHGDLVSDLFGRELWADLQDAQAIQVPSCATLSHNDNPNSNSRGRHVAVSDESYANSVARLCSPDGDALGNQLIPPGPILQEPDHTLGAWSRPPESTLTPASLDRYFLVYPNICHRRSDGLVSIVRDEASDSSALVSPSHVSPDSVFSVGSQVFFVDRRGGLYLTDLMEKVEPRIVYDNVDTARSALESLRASVNYFQALHSPARDVSQPPTPIGPGICEATFDQAVDTQEPPSLDHVPFLSPASSDSSGFESVAELGDFHNLFWLATSGPTNLPATSALPPMPGDMQLNLWDEQSIKTSINTFVDSIAQGWKQKVERACHLCNANVRRPSEYKNHLYGHWDIREFKCKHCEYASNLKQNLSRHLERVHGG